LIYLNSLANNWSRLSTIQPKEIDLFYFDDQVLPWNLGVPYAWQPRGETIESSLRQKQALNVLGFVNARMLVYFVVFEGSVTSAVVVASIDHFISTLQRTELHWPWTMLNS